MRGRLSRASWRQGQQRNLVTLFHALDWAFARSMRGRGLACARCGIERPVRGDPVDRDELPVEENIGVTCLFSAPDRFGEFRAQVASSSTVSLTAPLMSGHN
jgi:hypothetical protein